MVRDDDEDQERGGRTCEQARCDCGQVDLTTRLVHAIRPVGVAFRCAGGRTVMPIPIYVFLVRQALF
ncbi:hypothetical protein BLA34_12355 [Ralstonia solanacearum]|nr:hypothetical protein BLA34_12355 [Ralstonia solanacearum]